MHKKVKKTKVEDKKSMDNYRKCSIYLEGHKWAEKFILILNEKGKVKRTDFALF